MLLGKEEENTRILSGKEKHPVIVKPEAPVPVPGKKV